MATKRKKALPDKPSALIRLAIRDLIATEKHRHDVIRMDVWCVPIWDEPKATVSKAKGCEVCLAGAVMRRSLQTSPSEGIVFPQDFPDGITAKLDALDEFRIGHCSVGLEQMGISELPAGIRSWYDITSYDIDPKLFKRDMRKLATTLAAAGL